MAEFDFSSYPKPQPPANPLDTVTKMGAVADTLGNIQAGKAVQGAIQADGSIDRNALAQSLKSTVAGSMKAIPTLDAFEKLRAAGHLADTAGVDNFQKRMALVNGAFSQIAAMDNPSIKDVNSIAARLTDPALGADKFGINIPLIMNALKAFRGPDGRPLPPAEIKKAALRNATMAAHTAEQLSVLSPRYEAVNDGNTWRLVPVGPSINPQYPAVTQRIPTGTEVMDPATNKRVRVPAQPPAPIQYSDSRGVIPGANASDVGRNNPLDAVVQPAPAASTAPRSPFPTPDTVGKPVDPTATPVADIPLDTARSATFADRFAPSLRGAPLAGLAPGEAEAMGTTAQNSAGIYNALANQAVEVPNVRGILLNLERELAGFTSGPGADYKRIAKAFANTVLPESWQKEGSVLDPKSIADQEGFNKFAYNLAQRQFHQLGGTGTDAKLNSTMATSPSELLSNYGNQGIIRILKGNNDAIEVQAREANKYRRKHGDTSANEFVNEFNQHFDPRVFQFKYIPKKERQDWYKSMSPEERKSFKDAADYALAKGWIKGL